MARPVFPGDQPDNVDANEIRGKLQVAKLVQSASNDQDSSVSPASSVVITFGCVFVAIVAAVFATYGLYRLTVKIKRRRTPSGILKRRLSSQERHVSVLSASEQLYENMTPRRRELLFRLRGSAQFHSPDIVKFQQNKPLSLTHLPESLVKKFRSHRPYYNEFLSTPISYLQLQQINEIDEDNFC